MAFFEILGRFFFEKNRIWLFLTLLCTPFLITISFLFARYEHLRDYEITFDGAALRARSAMEKREKKVRFFQRYAHCEPYYINQQLETLPLLQAELNQLEEFQKHPGCSQHESISRRLAFLTGPHNRLAFAEDNVHSSAKVKETEEKLLHPVEIDLNDLDRLLSLIEGIPVGSYEPIPFSPQLLIHDFLLSKKDPSTYKLNLFLLKREFNLSNETKN